MSTKIKITLIAAVTLFFQSCNMAKHYGNMRIGHSKEKVENISAEADTEVKKEIIIVKTVDDALQTADMHPKPEFGSEKISEHDSTNFKANVIPSKLVHKNKKTTRVNKSMPAKILAKILTKVRMDKTRKSIRNPFKKASAAKWIDVEETTTQIVILLLVALILFVIALISGGDVAAAIFAILAGAGLIIAGALAFGLLIMGFLRMCGLDW